MAADGFILPVGAAGPVGLGRADEPEIVPALWRQHRVQQPVDLERKQVVDIAKGRELLKPVKRLSLPAHNQQIEIAGDPGIGFVRRGEIALPRRPLTGEIARDVKPARRLHGEAVGRARAPEGFAIGPMRYHS